jgi:DNA polymerase-4
MPDRSIVHVDMDAFYASVETLDDPSLAGKPVIVGGTPEERGVVASASYEARAFGVRSAMSSFRARKICPQAVFVRPRMKRYSEISRMIFDLMREYTPLLEPISIDEAFLDLTGTEKLMGGAEKTAREIKRRIKEEIGLNASVGVAPNKFLAKLASGLCKPDGFLVIESGSARSILDPLPPRKIWGVGEVAARKLAAKGITTIRDLRSADARLIESVFGSRAGRIIELARGIDDRPVEPRGEPKSIGAERTFARDIGDERELIRRLDSLSERVAARLRKEGFRARTVQLKARFPDFTTVTRALTLPSPVAGTRRIQEAARKLFREKLDRRGRPLRLIGVSLSNLCKSEADDADLFDADADDKLEKIDFIVDDLRRRFGPGAIRLGGSDKDTGGETR